MLRIIIFVLVVVVIWGGAHLYIARRLAAPHHWKTRRWIYVLFAAHFALYPVAQGLQQFQVEGGVTTVMQWAAYIGMGSFTFLWVLIVLRDLGWLGFLGVEKLVGEADEKLLDDDRRQFLTAGLNLGALGATGLATGWGMYQARRLPDVVDVAVPFEDLPEDLDGFRIVQLSDIHVGPTIRRPTIEAIVERVNALKPDLVAITGDLVDGFIDQLWHDAEPLLNLESRYGTYYVTGNHEYYWDALNWCERLADEGIQVLTNEHQVVKHGSGRILMAGCTDYTAGRYIPEHESDPKGAREGAPDHDVSILLAHQPPSIHEAADAGYDLQLSGHTHGGQFWPWIYVVGRVHPFATGLNRQDDTWIYVSRGTGYWGPPMRIGAPSEITLITLRRGEEADAHKIRRDGEELA